MNLKIVISSVVVSSLVLISCKKELEPQKNTPTSELVKLGLVKDTTKTKSVVQAPAANPNTVLSDTKGLNPAHGQAGHRCDIAVGAPLNSPATAQQQAPNTTTTGAANMQVINTNQKNVVTTSTVTPVKVAKGMNPAHGQPGHRCDIPVGTPLNSPIATKPVAAAPQGGSTSKTFSVTPPATTANPVPALLSTEAPVATAEGMNPPHGQTGHRCDIAVGAPLPKS